MHESVCINIPLESVFKLVKSGWFLELEPYEHHVDWSTMVGISRSNNRKCVRQKGLFVATKFGFNAFKGATLAATCKNKSQLQHPTTKHSRNPVENLSTFKPKNPFVTQWFTVCCGYLWRSSRITDKKRLFSGRPPGWTKLSSGTCQRLSGSGLSSCTSINSHFSTSA